MFGRTARAFKDDIVNIDDATQAFFREKLLGLPDKGRPAKDSPLSDVRHTIGRTFFRVPSGSKRTDQYMNLPDKRNSNPDNWDNTVGIGLQRALQAGVITGAGASLVGLGQAIGNQFGSAADSPSPSEIPPG